MLTLSVRLVRLRPLSIKIGHQLLGELVITLLFSGRIDKAEAVGD
ncbi:MAG: hypothetical protein OQK78_08155 [Gammaproteobacteria bacterium]|nr:hypothetical protein [Gammaproteobacteria bacterium]